MAGIRVIRNTENLDKYNKGIEEIDPIIRVAATKLNADLLKAFAKSSNLSDKSTNKKLTDDYAETKAESGRNPVRDLNVSGRLTQSFAVKKESFGEYSVGPRGTDEQAKMEGNVGYDENLMKVGDKARKKIIDFVNDRIKKGNK